MRETTQDEDIKTFTGTVVAVHETAGTSRAGHAYKRVQVFASDDEGSKMKFNAFSAQLMSKLGGRMLESGDRVKLAYKQALSSWNGKQVTFNNIAEAEILEERSMFEDTRDSASDISSNDMSRKLDTMLELLQEMKSMLVKATCQHHFSSDFSQD